MLIFVFSSFAQQQADTSKVPINILNTIYYEHITTDSGEVNKLIGNVELEQNGTLMYCDSAYLNVATNYLEAFNNVHIIQPGGTDVTSDYLRYTGNNKLAYLSGNCNLTDGKNNLQCAELNYNLGTKIAEYFSGGRLNNNGTIVTSNYGLYNINTKESRFTEQVVIDDPEYHITSTDIGYNTGTKLTRFFGPSVVVNDKSTLTTKSGTWDGLYEIAHFVKRSSFVSGAQYIEADSMDYSKPSAMGIAKGRVVAIDTAQKTTLYSGQSEYNELTEELFAFIKPVMKKMTGDDSLFIRADTFFSAPTIPIKIDSARLRVADSIRNAKIKKHKAANKKDSIRIATAKTSLSDTTKAGSLSGGDEFPGTLQVTDSAIEKSKQSHLGKWLTIRHIIDSLLAYKRSKEVILVDTTQAARITPTVKIDIENSSVMVDDSVGLGIDSLSGHIDTNDSLLRTDSLLLADSNDVKKPEDTATKRYFIAYHHVLIFSDSLQGKCDSLSYSQKDSVMKMMYTPIVWSRNSQITGDTIMLYTDSSNLRKLYVPYDGFMISRSGPPKAKLFDQVQGRTITGYFTNNTITHMVVEPEAEAIYYSKDDNDAYLGVNEASGLRMRIVFKDQKISLISFETDTKQKMTPMKQAEFDKLKLSRFQWHEDKRPKSLEELFQ